MKYLIIIIALLFVTNTNAQSEITTFKFENLEFPVSCNLSKKEKVVVDTSKYSLVVFAVSWCKSCLYDIPILKQIYIDLFHKLDMVYLTIDEETNLISWCEIMDKEKIPWRSLSVLDKVFEVESIYHNNEGTPFYMLVSPSGDAIALNINNQNDREYLYQLIK